MAEVCPVQQYLNQSKDYYIQQISTGCLAQFAYYIESNGEAIIIDPMRDVENILNLLKTRNSKLKYVLETHFHADFVSGHVDLKNKTQAEIVFGQGAVANYKILSANDGEILTFGNLKIKVLTTPGHTLESSCFILMDKTDKQIAIFTGDTVFLGDVGRPDLAVKSDLSDKDLAKLLYNSIKKISKLPEDIIIFPGHGAGSACGKSISAGIGDTLKNQKLKNFAFSENLTEEEFVELATSNLPSPPSYFFFDARMNKEGYQDIDKLLENSIKALKYDEFNKLFNSPDVITIDSRDIAISSNEFVKGSHLIPLNINYAVWCATLFNPEQKIILITNPGTEKESIVRLFRVGYNNVLGYLDGGIDKYRENNKENLVSIRKIDFDEGKKMIDENKIDLVDVREVKEFENTGVIDNSKLFPLSELEKKVLMLKNLDKPLGVYCRTGARATIASSILFKNNITNFYWLGTFSGLAEKGAKIIKYIKK